MNHPKGPRPPIAKTRKALKTSHDMERIYQQRLREANEQIEQLFEQNAKLVADNATLRNRVEGLIVAREAARVGA